MLHPLQISRYIARYPIIQGAMAVRVSGARLAAAVANAGGIGLIASFGIGLNSGHHRNRQFFVANQVALIDELRQAREISPDGILGVNAIVATKDYAKMARTAAAYGANLIVTAAGLPLNLPEYLKDYPDVALVPIVANIEAAQTLCETWYQRYQRLPDALIVENYKSIGGHFASQYEDGNIDSIDTTISKVRNYLTQRFAVHIPLIVTGGIWDREDIDGALSMGADGVQIGTRFITTEECGADLRYKEFHLQAHSHNLVTVPSPVSKPARAMENQFTADILAGSPTLEKRCVANCLESCLCRDKGQTYCLIQALDRAAQGDIERGLIFSGGAVKSIDRILSVSELMSSLTD